MTMNTVFVAHEIVHAVWRALNAGLPGARLCRLVKDHPQPHHRAEP